MRPPEDDEVAVIAAAWAHAHGTAELSGYAMLAFRLTHPEFRKRRSA
jgi:hypothetical protein